jgi:hypothetical protein
MACHTCRTPLADLEISPEPEQQRAERLASGTDTDPRLRFYCHLDWHELFAPRCYTCKTTIIGEHVLALGRRYHNGHFFCAECGDPFTSNTPHVESEGYAYCVECAGKRTERRAPKCGLCKGPVVGEVVMALGREFHEGCFRCGACGGGFREGEIYLDGECGVVCRTCMERGLKVGL